MTHTIPDRIWLQWFDEYGNNDPDPSWSQDKIHNTDVLYVQIPEDVRAALRECAGFVVEYHDNPSIPGWGSTEWPEPLQKAVQILNWLDSLPAAEAEDTGEGEVGR